MLSPSPSASIHRRSATAFAELLNYAVRTFCQPIGSKTAVTRAVHPGQTNEEGNWHCKAEGLSRHCALSQASPRITESGVNKTLIHNRLSSGRAPALVFLKSERRCGLANIEILPDFATKRQNQHVFTQAPVGSDRSD